MFVAFHELQQERGWKFPATLRTALRWGVPVSMADGNILYLIQEEWAAHIQRCFHDMQLQAGCSEAVNAVAAAAQTFSLKVQGLLCAEQVFQGTDLCFKF